MNIEKIKIDFPRIKLNEPLKQHSTFRVGGPADLFFEAQSKEDLMAIISMAAAEKIPYKIIGRGTNCLFTDKGYRGLIIKNLASKIIVTGNFIEVESGALWAQVLNEAIKHSLTGMEALYGLPGSIGAAVWGNAGVPGVETANFVRTVDLFNPHEGLRTIDLRKKPKDILFEYRHTSLQDSPETVVAALLELKPGNAEESKALMKKINETRLAKQPIGFSAGSFFKNPNKEQSAGMLIDQAGLKGTKIGGAEISTKHGNFFLNSGNATFADICALRDLAVKTVQEKFGITLEMEAKIIGDE